MYLKELLLKWNIALSSSRMSCSGADSVGPASTLCDSLSQLKVPTPLVPNHTTGHDAESVLSALFWRSISIEPCLMLSVFLSLQWDCFTTKIQHAFLFSSSKVTWPVFIPPPPPDSLPLKRKEIYKYLRSFALCSFQNYRLTVGVLHPDASTSTCIHKRL
jgi:hypothetical protein